MNLPGILTLIGVFLGSSVLTALVTLYFTRPKLAAETKEINAKAASEEMNTTNKASDLIKEMQGQIVVLYKQNTELEKENTDKTRTIETLSARLEARDKQLERLSSLAEASPIIETLQKQLDAVTNIAAGFQTTQSELQNLLTAKEKTMQELQQTNRDLEMRKPLKS